MKYTVINKKTKKIKEIDIPMSETDNWKKKNPGWEFAITAPSIHSGSGLGLKSMRNDDTFKDQLRSIDKKFPGNTLKNYVNF